MTNHNAGTSHESYGRLPSISADEALFDLCNGLALQFDFLISRIGRFVLVLVFAVTGCTIVPVQPGSRIVLRDNQFFTAGPFGAYASPWNRTTLVENVDFSDRIELIPDSFPFDTDIKSNWPTTPSSSVYGFMQISYGDLSDSYPQTSVPSLMIADVQALTAAHDVTFSGGAADFDAIYDMFLTATPKGQQLFELEVFLHTPNYSANFVNGSSQLGTFRSSGVTWTVAISGLGSPTPDILFMPTDLRDVAHGKVNLSQMFEYLISKKILTGTEYFNGFAIGLEPRRGHSVMRVHSFRVNYLQNTGQHSMRRLSSGGANG